MRRSRGDDELWNYGIVVSAAGLLSLGLGFLVGVTSIHEQGLEYWLNRYQALIAGMLAIVAAFIAAFPVRSQLREMKTQSAVSAREIILETIEENNKRLKSAKAVEGFLRRVFEGLDRLEGDPQVSHWIWDRQIEIDNFQRSLASVRRYGDREEISNLLEQAIKSLDDVDLLLYHVNLTVHIEGPHEEGFVSEEEYNQAPERESEAKEKLPMALDGAIHCVAELVLALHHENEQLDIDRRDIARTISDRK